MNPYDSYREHLLNFPKQLSSKAARVVRVEKLRDAKPDGIVVVGMGGSGLPGTFLEALAAEHGLTVPVVAWKDHGLPKTVFRRPLYIFISFSGNTEETLSGLKALLRRRGKGSAAVVMGGGKLKAMAEKHRLPLAVVENAGGLTPREGVGYLYYNLLSLLRVPFPSLVVRDLSHVIRSGRGERLGKDLAKRIAKKTVLIYTTGTYAHLGTAWQTVLDETAKQETFTGTYPEMGHNEVAALRGTRHAAVFLESRSASIHEKRHLETIKRVIAREGVAVLPVPLTGRTREEQTWNAFLLGHWTALALARQNNVGPQRTPLIEQLKKEIG